MESLRHNNLEQDQKQQYKPTRILPHSSCVTAVAFHPKVVGLLAAATFTGDLFIWVISGDENIDALLTSTIGNQAAEVTHSDSISVVYWLPSSSSSSKHPLAVTGNDGLITIWSVNPLRKKISLKAGYKFKAGICSLSLNVHDSVTFAAGLASGSLVFWSLVSDPEQSIYTLDFDLTTTSVPVYNVSGSTIQASSGPLYGCEWSPACPGLIAVATCDGTVLLYSQRDPTSPCLRLESSNCGALFSLCFSRSRPLLLLSASQFEGAIVFDLSNSGPSSVVGQLKAPPNLNNSNEKNATISASFNPGGGGRSSIYSLVAVGCENGSVYLWRISLDSEGENDFVFALQSLRNLVSGQEMKDTEKSHGKKSDAKQKKKKKKKMEIQTNEVE